MLRKKSYTKDYILYDSIYRKCPQGANLPRRKVGKRVLSVGMGLIIKRYEVFYKSVGSVLKLIYDDGCTTH